MTTQAAQSPAFPRFRGGFGLASRTKDAKVKSGEEEDWVIPYNGPYEAPPPRRPKARDSWGDPLEDYADDDSMVDARELHLRYGGHNDFSNTQSSGGSKPIEEERKSRARDRSFSVMSGRTTSSGAVDPNRASLATNRRSTVSSSLRPPVPSYINLDPMGGVGESPVPHVRNSRDNTRISLASIFSLGGLVRKTASSPALSVDRHSSARKAGRSSRPSTSEKPIRRTESPQPRRSTSTDSRRSRRPSGRSGSKLRQAEQTSLTATDEEDYYNSYYSTLISKDEEIRHHPLAYAQPQSPNSSLGSHNSNSPRQRQHPNVSRQNSTSTTSGHPYAYVFPQIRIPDPPRTAPPVPTPQMASAQVPSPSNYHPPRLTFTTAGGPQQQGGPSSADAAHAAFSPRSAGARSLRSPASTPDLRIRVPANVMAAPGNTNANKNAPGFSFPKGKDKWLSAETWCDALLFPRPRLKLKQDPVEGPIPESSGRIVSPPSTPLGQDDFGLDSQQQRPREPGIASRVLAHSRSLVDLNKGKQKAEDIQHPLASSSRDPQTSRAGPQSKTVRPPRPKSFAQDDLALPTPTPSLAHVLREGELLESQRREWQKQAAGSWGNKRARSVSRTRAKSLTKQGRLQQAKHQHQSSMEYMAAKACLGSQPLTPIIIPPKPSSSYFSDAHTTTISTDRSRGTHFRGDSMGKTTTSSSKTHSKNHSRNESWGKSAVKMAKSTVICGHPSGDEEDSIIGDRTSDRVLDLEGALKRNDTKVIRLADPAHIPVDRGLAVHPHPQPYPQTYIAQPRHTPSPAESRLSDSKVGIALGSPPEEGPGYIPNHPYAQGGLSFANGLAPSPSEQPPRPADYAGSHPSINTGLKPPQIPENVARHKLPPHMVLHPYAQQSQSNRDSYLDANGLIGQYRSEDATPHPSKMWAQLSPGVVREILPEDLKYSPFLPESGRASPSPARQSIAINDMVGLGEALVNATRYGPGGGSSQGHSTATVSASAGSHATPQQPSEHPSWEEQQEQEQHELDLPEFGYRPRRNGFMDFSMAPLGRPKLEDKPSDPSTNHTHASSQLEYLPTPPTEREASTADTVESSPPESPRPLGSPHDLEGFQDLFYRPTHATGRTPREAALPETPSPPNRGSTPWDLMPNRRTGNSSLTSLARQLTDEFEAMALERLGERFGEGRSSSQYSQSPTNSFRRQTPLRRPTDGNSLQFVFEEASAGSALEGGSRTSMLEDHEPVHAFQASETLPEDVQSSRASSFIEGTAEDDDPTAVFRVGKVESVSTPPTISSSHHLSAEQSAFVHNRQEQRRSGGLESPLSQNQDAQRVSSSLQPPTEATRSSYMTTSTLSRMSGLSDFPSPPKDDYLSAKHHVSMLSSYFNEAHAQNDAHVQDRAQAQGPSQSQPHLSPIPPTPQEELGEDELLHHSVMFGVNENAATVAEGLSSQSPPPPNVPAPPF